MLLFSLKNIRNLTFFSTLFTLVVISVGAWVRLTDAGLGCPDWPGCYGILGTPDTEIELTKARQAYPDAEIDIGKAWREMFHRYLAGILGIMVFFISYCTLKYAKNVSKIIPYALSILIIIQSIMGMLTVTELVKPTIVTTHLILGIFTAVLLFWNALLVHYAYKISIHKLSDEHLIISKRFHINNFSIFIFICILALIAQIILGGWTSTNYASLACTDFPKCTNQWWPTDMNFSEGFTIFNLSDINYELAPLPYDAKLAIHFTHRIGALLIILLYITLFLFVFFMQKNILLKKISLFVLFFFITQIILGISNVVYSLPITIAVAHTVNAAILLISMITLLYYSTNYTQR